MTRLQPDKLERLRKRHLRGAFVRSGASAVMWLVMLTAFFMGAIEEYHFVGITISVSYLILINPPLLLALNRFVRRRSYEIYSLFINQLEIIGYTAIIYWCGGIEAAYLTLTYAALIAYVGVLAPRRHSFIVAGQCICTYILMIGLVYYEILPHPKPTYDSNMPLRVQLFVLSVVIGLLYVVAYISATTANLLKLNRRKLAQQNRQLAAANQKMSREVEVRKRAEIALKENEARYRSLVENTLYGYFTVKVPSGAFLFLNMRICELFGYRMREALRLKIWDVLHPDEQAGVKQTIQAMLEGKSRLRDNPSYTIVRKDYSTFQAEIYLSLVTSGGKPLVQGVVRDVTEEKELADRLHMAQRLEAIGTLAGGIAHNFNNLLMGIQGNASLAALSLAPADPNLKNLENIEKLVKSGSRLTNQLIGYAREGRYEVRPLDLNQLIKEIASTFGAAKREIRLHQDLHEGLMKTEADQGQIEQVLLNLLVNAADAMPEGGDVFLKTDNVTHEEIKCKPDEPSPGNYVMVSVRDTGFGMDKKTVEHIFEPFYTTKGLGKGTGLGLASAYGIVKGHGGYIDVDSQKGKGTAFVIYLPAKAMRTTNETDFVSGPVKGTGTILLVDDEEAVIEVGEKILEELGYRTMTARGGNEAIALFRRSRDEIDLVILDMIMPDMTGRETYDGLKALKPEMKCLLLSGYSLDGQAAEILAHGCNGFLQKPFSIDDFSRKIREILDMNPPERTRPLLPAQCKPKSLREAADA